MEKLLYESNNGIAWLTFNRPEWRNAIDYDVMNELERRLEEIEQNDSDKVLVITGSGDQAFCSGGDLSVFHNLKTEEASYEMLSRMGKILYRLFQFSKPTAALLNGTAVGGGCEIASACDFRFAHAGVKIGFIQGTLGITTGWGGASMLYERLSADDAMSLLMSARQVGASDAQEMGFLNQIFEKEKLRQSCMKALSNFTDKEIGVLKSYKQVFVDKMNSSSFNKRFEQEIKRCSVLWATDEHHRAVERFLQRKKE